MLTSTHTCSPQLPVAVEIPILNGVVEVGTSLSPPPVVVQVISTAPFCKAGITAVFVLLITSIDMGVFENWIGSVPLAVVDASKQIWYKTWSSATLIPCKVLSSQPTRNWPAVVVLKFGAPKPDKPTWLIVALFNCVPSQFNECWKANIPVKPAVLTSTHTWAPQFPVAVEIAILSGVLLVGGDGSSTSVSPPQVIVAVPFCNTGIIGFPSKSIISIGTGELENWIGLVPLVVADASKQTWYKTWSAPSVIPCKELSSQPILNIPGVVILKLAALKSGNPNWLIRAVPKSLASQIKECWKAKTLVKPDVLTSTHICAPQAPVTSEIRIVKSVLFSSVGVVGVVSVPSHSTDTLPSVKVGVKGTPSLSIISIGIGLFEKEIGEVRVAPEEALKHNWNNTWPSGTVRPTKEASSQPIRTWPAKLVLKLLAVSPANPKFCTVAVPNSTASQFIEYWNANISVKPSAVTSTQVCSPQLTVVEAALIVNGVAEASVLSVLLSSVSVAQVTVTDPFCKLGVKAFPSKSVTSILKGTSLIAIEFTPLALVGTSKHTWYRTKSSGRLSPFKEESSQATLNCPGIAKLKLVASKSVNPKAITCPVPNLAKSQFKECWKEKTSEKPVALTSTQLCSPQIPVTLLTDKPKLTGAVGGGGGAGLSGPLTQFTVIDPFWKFGLNSLPALFTISIVTGAFTNWTRLVPDTLFGVSKHNWNNTLLSGRLTPPKVVSSHPTRTAPGVVLLKLLGTKSSIPNCPIVATPKRAASQAILYWKVRILSKSWVVTLIHTWSPQLDVAVPSDILIELFCPYTERLPKHIKLIITNAREECSLIVMCYNEVK